MNKNRFFSLRRGGVESVMIMMCFVILFVVATKYYNQTIDEKSHNYYKTHQEEISYKKTGDIYIESLNQNKPDKLVALGDGEILYRDKSSHDMAIDKYKEGQIEIVKNDNDNNTIEIYHAYDKKGNELNEDVYPYKYVLNIPNAAISTDYKILNTVQESSGFRTHTVTYTPSGVDLYN